MSDGNYWIIGSRIESVPKNSSHYGVALDLIGKDYVNDLLAYAKSLGIDTSEYDKEVGKYPGYVLQKLITYVLETKSKGEVAKELGIDEEIMGALAEPWRMMIYVLKTLNWIAIRHIHIELYGLDFDKRQNLYRGLNRLLDKGLIDYNSMFYLEDHKVGRRMRVSLEDIGEGNFFKAQDARTSNSYHAVMLRNPKGWMECLVLDFRNFCLWI